MRRILFLIAAMVCLGHAALSGATDQAPVPGSGAAPTHASLDPVMAKRLKLLETELRCLVCQNQTLADSEAGLAQDLRNQIEALALEGKSDEEIKAWLQARYGDFVLYRPPVKPLTWFLWFGPFVLLVGAIVFWAIRLKRRRLLSRSPDGAGDDFDGILDKATRRA